MRRRTPFKSISALLLQLSLLFVPGTVLSQQTDLALLPTPASIERLPGRLVIDGGLSISTSGNGSSLLERALHLFAYRLEKRTGMPMMVPQSSAGQRPVLEILCESEGDPVPSLSSDESYALEISSLGARLLAPSPIGILRGLETLLQLVTKDGNSFFLPFLRIEDRPRFRWRGLFIDVSRHFQPVSMIKKNLDAMAAVKMNVLHWHLSDDQGFRVESRSFPKLHLLGSDGEYYTQEEIRDVVDYARERGIRVVPEFDMPGHSTSWLVGYPELAAAPGPYSIERGWGVFDPCMDPSSEELYKFLDVFVGEMSELFPDEYFHIGGDEVRSTQWNSNEDIQDFKRRNNIPDNRALQAYFNRRLLGILAGHGKKMIGWDEIFHPDLPRSIVIQSWRGQASLAESARQGYSGILSSGYYLDHMRPASFHYEIDPLGNEASDLTAAQQQRILGGEACMWAEFVDSENIESRIWPRTAAIAERLWSPPEVNDIPDLYRRLELVDNQLVMRGLNHHSLYLERLRHLASGSVDIQPLLIFADLLKPPSLSVRKKARAYTSRTPLNRLVDILMPESKVAREFSDLVEKFLDSPAKDSDGAGRIRSYLDRWERNDPELRRMLERSSSLQETLPLAGTVSELCKYGLEALSSLQSGRKPSQIWQKQALDLLETAEKPQAEIYIAVFVPLRDLITAAISLP